MPELCFVTFTTSVTHCQIEMWNFKHQDHFISAIKNLSIMSNNTCFQLHFNLKAKSNFHRILLQK